MAALWNANNLNLNDQTGIIDVPAGHIMHLVMPGMLTPPGLGGGVHTISMYYIHLMAMALYRLMDNLHCVHFVRACDAPFWFLAME